MNLEPPKLQVVAIEPLKAVGADQRFRIKLRALNPNRVALPISGMSYTLTVEDFDLAEG